MKVAPIMMRVFHRIVFSLIGSLSLVAAVGAEERELVASLTLDQLAADAVRDNAQLRSLRAKWEAMQERPVQQTTLPNPMLALKSGNGADDFSFPKTQETRVMLEQTFPWFGKLGLRGKVADKEAEAMGREYDAMAREVRMMVKENYFNLYAVQRSLSITRTEEDVLKRMAKIAETKYSTGEATQQDVLKAQAEITMLQARLWELEKQELVIKAKLNQLLNRRADAPLGLAVNAPAAEFDAQTAPLLELAEKSRPEIKKARLDIARSQYQRDLSKKDFFPDYRLGVEYGHMDSGFVDFSGSEHVVMFTVGIELPIWQSKYKAGVREAEKMIESSKAALEATQQQTAFDVQDAHFKVLTARRTLELYQKTLIPQAKARFDASEAGYRTGKVDFLDLLESERFLLSTRVMAAMAEGDLGMQAARLERAVGMDLSKLEKRQ